MKHFTINELTRSATAAELGINNEPDFVSMTHLCQLIETVLDPLREAWGKPIVVNSGYRSEALNKAVGGAATSQHTKGQAADITTGTVFGNKWLFNYIKENLPFDQLIDEKNYRWIHVSYRADGKNRRQTLHL